MQIKMPRYTLLNDYCYLFYFISPPQALSQALTCTYAPQFMSWIGLMPMHHPLTSILDLEWIQSAKAQDACSRYSVCSILWKTYTRRIRTPTATWIRPRPQRSCLFTSTNDNNLGRLCWSVVWGEGGLELYQFPRINGMMTFLICRSSWMNSSLSIPFIVPSQWRFAPGGRGLLADLSSVPWLLPNWKDRFHQWMDTHKFTTLKT